jgi:hypothetical protein
MDDFRIAEAASFAAPFAQLGSDATRRVCEQNQRFAKAMSEWNTEVGQFLSHRLSCNLDTIARITKCGNLQEVISIQMEWFRDATDEYLKEIGKLTQINGEIVSDALRPVQEVAVQSAERARSPSAKVPMKVSS